jgi:predicted membrane metal-binding protein
MTYAAIVDTGTLLKVVAYALGAGIGVSVVVGAGVSSVASLLDAMRERRTTAGAAWAMLALACLAVAAAVVVLGLIVMTSKR